MKGYLDVKDLEKYKKTDLQQLAKDLGVSTEGTIKEIAARCAAVEVEIPDEQAPTQNGQDDQNGQDNQTPNQGGQDNQAPNQDGHVTVEVVRTYKDLELKRTVRKGERLPMKGARAAVIVEKKLGKIV